MRPGIAVLLILALFPLGAAAGEDAASEAIVREMNIARTDPAGYVKKLHRLRRAYRGKFIVRGDSSLQTSEGVRAVDEAIRVLKKCRPVAPLQISGGLAEAAEALVRDQGPAGATGHTGPTTGSTRERIEKAGKWSGTIGENVAYGSTDPEFVVLQLVVDDGVPSRGHRKNILDPSFRRAGAACGDHSQFRGMCVIDFATEFHR